MRNGGDEIAKSGTVTLLGTSQGPPSPDPPPHRHPSRRPIAGSVEVSCLSSGAGQKRGCPARPWAWTGRTGPPGPSMGGKTSDGPPPAPITASPRPPDPVPSGPLSRQLAGTADLTGPLCAEAGNRPPGLRRGTAPTTGQTGGRGRCTRNLHVVGPATGPPPRPSATVTPRGRPPKPPDPGHLPEAGLREEEAPHLLAKLGAAGDPRTCRGACRTRRTWTPASPRSLSPS